MMQQLMYAIGTNMDFSVPDVMWNSIYWLDEIPKGSRVVIYGAGRLGKAYYRQLTNDSQNRLTLSAWVDKNQAGKVICDHVVDHIDVIADNNYDYILIAVMDKSLAERIISDICDKYRITRDQVIWLEQREAFWDFAEYAGYLT